MNSGKTKRGDGVLAYLKIASIFNFSILIIFLFLLFFGLFQCRKNSFSAGFYFFLILIVTQILTFVIQPLIGFYVNNRDDVPFGITMGEFTALILGVSYMIETILKMIAFTILIIGLYRIWHSNLYRNSA